MKILTREQLQYMDADDIAEFFGVSLAPRDEESDDEYFEVSTDSPDSADSESTTVTEVTTVVDHQYAPPLSWGFEARS